MQFEWYYRWHMWKNASIAHFFVLFGFILGLFFGVYSAVVPHSAATNISNSVGISTQAGWDAGTKTNIDSAVTPGSIKIADPTKQKNYVDISSEMLTASPSAGAGNIIDNDNCSAWHSTDAGSYFQIDLGQVIENGYTSWLSSNNPGVSYGAFSNPPSVSMNGVDWSPMPYYAQDNSPAGVCNGDANDWRYDSGPSTFRYIRVTAFPVGDPPVYQGPTNDFKVYTLGNPTGTHISAATQLDNQNENASWTTLDVSATVPENTGLKFRFRTSADAGTWGSWTSYADYAPSINIGTLLGNTDEKKQYLQVESQLKSFDNVATPIISSYTANFSAMCPTNTKEQNLGKTVSSETEWEQGSLYNIDSTSGPGDIKIDTSLTPVAYALSSTNSANLNYVNDGVTNDCSKYWASGPDPDGTSYIQVDLGKETTLNFDLWSGAYDGKAMYYATPGTDGSAWGNYNWLGLDSQYPSEQVASCGENEYINKTHFNGTSQFGGSPIVTRYLRIGVASPPDNIGYKIFDWKIYTPSTYTSAPTQLDGGDNFVTWTTFAPSGSIPANTSIGFRFRTSDNASAWGPWTASTAYSASIDVGALLGDTDKVKRYLQVETTLANTDGSSTPTLGSYTANYTECTPNTPASTCSDGIQNGSETGVDCGGSCGACPTQPTCSDGVKNGDETSADCGGSCGACPVEPTCSDKIRNGGETGVDCGGSCSECPITPPIEPPLVCPANDVQGYCATYAMNHENSCAAEQQCLENCQPGFAGMDQSLAIRVTSPNGGESYQLANRMKLDWVYAKNNGTNTKFPDLSKAEKSLVSNTPMAVVLSTNGGTAYDKLLSVLYPDDKFNSVPSPGNDYAKTAANQYGGFKSYTKFYLYHSSSVDLGYYTFSLRIPDVTSLVTNNARIKLVPVEFGCVPIQAADTSDGDFVIQESPQTQCIGAECPASAISMVINPSDVELKPQSRQQFSATIANFDGGDITDSCNISWSLASPDAGGISQNGLFSAGSKLGSWPNLVQAEALCGEEQTSGLASVSVVSSGDGGGNGNNGGIVNRVKTIIASLMSSIRGIGSNSSSNPITAIVAIMVGALALAPQTLGFANTLIAPYIKGKDRKITRSLVYNSVTGLPQPGVRVMLIEKGMNTLASVAVTDRDGKYVLEVSPGKEYEVRTEKNGFEQFKLTESQIEKSGLPYADNYFGGVFKSGDDQYLFNKNIPLTEIDTDNTTKKFIRRSRVSKILIALNVSIFLLGLGVTLIILVNYQTLLNYLILGLYIITLVIYLCRMLVLSGRDYGTVVNVSDNQAPVDLALIRAVRANSNELVKTVVGDARGRYTLALPRGEYNIYASKQGLIQRQPLTIKIRNSFQPRRDEIGLVLEDGVNDDSLPGEDS